MSGLQTSIMSSLRCARPRTCSQSKQSSQHATSKVAKGHSAPAKGGDFHESPPCRMQGSCMAHYIFPPVPPCNLGTLHGQWQGKSECSRLIGHIHSRSLLLLEVSFRREFACQSPFPPSLCRNRLQRFHLSWPQSHDTPRSIQSSGGTR